MKLTSFQKQELQCFVYFLFKGTLDPRLIIDDFDYMDKLLANPKLLYNCFEVLVYAIQTEELTNNFGLNNQPVKWSCGSDKLVADYILAIHNPEQEHFAKTLIEKAIAFNSQQQNLFTDFLTLAKQYCFNSFPNPIISDYLDTGGVGAVQGFAHWTNVIEIDENLKPLNSEYALKRANQRVKLYNDLEKPAVKFESWELKQEIY